MTRRLFEHFMKDLNSSFKEIVYQQFYQKMKFLEFLIIKKKKQNCNWPLKKLQKFALQQNKSKIVT